MMHELLQQKLQMEGMTVDEAACHIVDPYRTNICLVELVVPVLAEADTVAERRAKPQVLAAAVF